MPIKSTFQSRIADFEAMWGRVHPGRRMTEAEFGRWIDEETRAEWIDGEVEMTAPVGLEHDDLVGWLRTLLKAYVDHHQLGAVFGPEVLVRLARIRRQRLPDILYVEESRRAILKKNLVDGPPDLIMEVVSPDSAERDWIDKYADYEKAGVREYWIVDADARRLETYHLTSAGKYRRIGMKEDVVRSKVVPGFFIREPWVFLPGARPLLKVLGELGIRA